MKQEDLPHRQLDCCAITMFQSTAFLDTLLPAVNRSLDPEGVRGSSNYQLIVRSPEPGQT